MAGFMQLLKACLGDAHSQFRIAVDIWNQPPDKRDLPRALYWAKRAMRNEAPDSFALVQLLLGEMGAEKEILAMYVEIWRKAAEEGQAAAQ